jgi:ATP-dependent RNA helicase RhlE
MNFSEFQFRALVITSTRELAEQITDFIRIIINHTRLRSLAVYGNVSKINQIAKIRQGVDMVIAYPGRLLDIQNDKGIDLSQVKALIIEQTKRIFIDIPMAPSRVKYITMRLRTKN